MIGLAKRQHILISVDQNREVKAALARTLETRQREEAAKSETTRLRNYLSPSADFNEEISWQMQHEAITKLLPPHAGGITKEQVAAAQAHEAAMAEEANIRARVKSELDEAVRIHLNEDVLAEYEEAVRSVRRVTDKLRMLEAQTSTGVPQIGSVEWLENELAALRAWVKG